jgi:CPA2 family monovalent cation:H+ antiporter-2
LLKPVLEPPQSQLPALHPEVTLKQLVVDEKFPFLGMSIRASNIREKTSGLIVGIERNGQRILNPDPGTLFQKGDIVWLSGDRELVRAVGME